MSEPSIHQLHRQVSMKHEFKVAPAVRAAQKGWAGCGAIVPGVDVGARRVLHSISFKFGKRHIAKLVDFAWSLK